MRKLQEVDLLPVLVELLIIHTVLNQQVAHHIQVTLADQHQMQLQQPMLHIITLMVKNQQLLLLHHLTRMATATHIHTHQGAHISPISPLNKHLLQQNKMNNYHQKVKQLRRFIMSLVNLRKIFI